jgi:hypothetical protein
VGRARRVPPRKRTFPPNSPNCPQTARAFALCAPLTQPCPAAPFISSNNHRESPAQSLPHSSITSQTLPDACASFKTTFVLEISLRTAPLTLAPGPISSAAVTRERRIAASAASPGWSFCNCREAPLFKRRAHELSFDQPSAPNPAGGQHELRFLLLIPVDIARARVLKTVERLAQGP